MEKLPCLLLNEILFRLDRRDMAMMRCTNRYLRRHMSEEPYFEKEYKSTLHPISNQNLSSGGIQIIGFCSGLVLVFLENLFVVNPFTKQYRLVNYTWSRLLANGVIDQEKRAGIGFTVDEIAPNIQGFKIVCLIETKEEEDAKTMYKFEVSLGDSYWTLSKTTLTCHSSDLVKGLRPVYLDHTLYWLRNDGSIIAFNTVTEKAQLLQTEFRSLKTVLCAATELTLLSATEEAIHVYALKNKSKWVLLRRIPVVLNKNKRMMLSWKVAACDGKFLVVTEATKKDVMVVHEYDLRANKWTILQELRNCNNNEEFFQLRPSPSSVIGMNNLMGTTDSVLAQVQPQTCTLIDRLSLYLKDMFPSPKKRRLDQSKVVPCKRVKSPLENLFGVYYLSSLYSRNL